MYACSTAGMPGIWERCIFLLYRPRVCPPSSRSAHGSIWLLEFQLLCSFSRRKEKRREGDQTLNCVRNFKEPFRKLEEHLGENLIGENLLTRRLKTALVPGDNALALNKE